MKNHNPLRPSGHICVHFWSGIQIRMGRTWGLGLHNLLQECFKLDLKIYSTTKYRNRWEILTFQNFVHICVHQALVGWKIKYVNCIFYVAYRLEMAFGNNKAPPSLTLTEVSYYFIKDLFHNGSKCTHMCTKKINK